MSARDVFATSKRRCFVISTCKRRHMPIGYLLSVENFRYIMVHDNKTTLNGRFNLVSMLFDQDVVNCYGICVYSLQVHHGHMILKQMLNLLLSTSYLSGQNRQKITVKEFIFSVVSGYVA